MAAGHVYLQLLMAGLDKLDQQAGGASPLTTKGDLYGFSTVDKTGCRYKWPGIIG
jgi:hypothetical protein